MQLNVHSLIKSGKVIQYQPPFHSIVDFIEQLSKKYGNKPAIIFDDYSKKNIELSFIQLEAAIKKTTHFLSKYCSKQGDAISFCFPNTPEVILFNYAAWGHGWVTVPLDSKRDTTEIKIYKLQQTGAKVLFTRADKKTQKENQEIKKAITDLQIVELKNLDHFLELIEFTEKSTISSNKSTPLVNTDLDKTALILYTSGTTALPKGARLTIRSLFANAASISDWLQFDDTDRWQVVLPLHHINSSTFVNTTYLAGGTLVLVPQYSKSKFWKTMAEHQCTGTSIVPTIAYDLLSEQASFDKNQDRLKQIKRIQLGSAPVQPKVVKQFVKQFGIRLQQGYGQTETSLRSSGVPMGLTNDQYQHLVEINTLGTELAFTNLAVLDAQGNELGPNEEGEICVRGPIIMKDYLNNPQATLEAFKYNWFHSGDTGYWQDLSHKLGPKYRGKKFFFLKGRTKEIIKKGGVLISPLAIENALLKSYPDIKKVYVVGIANQRLGEEIGFVVVSDNQHIVEQVLSDCKNGQFTALSPYEYPVAGLKIDQSKLPLTSTGKVQRIKIKQLFGPKLAVLSTSIAQTDQHLFRVIRANETENLKQAVKINNQRWGKHLATSLEEFTDRAKNGVVIGMFKKPPPDKNPSAHDLIGTICGVQIDPKELEHAGELNHWTSTWAGITGQGHFTTSSHRGKALVLVAVSTKSSKTTTVPQPFSAQEKSELNQIQTQKKIAKKIASYQDSVIAFHSMAKGGLQKGAQIRAILPKARPTDLDSLGYCVLMQYPDLKKATPVINQDNSYGTQLVEAAMIFAVEQKITQLFAYSRPSSLRKNLL